MKKKKKLGNLETYGEEPEEETKKESLLKRIWNKTVFPDKIREKREKKEYEDELRKIAKEQAQEEIKETLVAQYKQEEIDKATKKKTSKSKDWSKKLAEGFSMSGSGSQDNKFVKALGGSNTGDMFGEDKIKSMIGVTSSGSYGNEFKNPKKNIKKNIKKKTTKKQPVKSDYDFEDKIKRML